MKPQKALHLHEDLDKKTPKSTGKFYYMFEKYDGWYGYYDFCVDNVIKSRACREIPSLTEFSKSITPIDIKGRLIFEILLRDVKEFSILNGILNRKAQAPNVYLKVHDFVPHYDPELRFIDRYQLAEMVVEKLGHPDIEMAPHYGSSCQESTWRNLANSIWSRGGEGIILKKCDAGYSAGKRNADLLKIKEELTLDLYVEGLVEGEGKYKGTTGALLVSGKDGLIHTVSGMTDEQRDTWWDSPILIKHHVVEVKAMKKLPCGSLREPRFKAVRYDKGLEDID